MKPWVKHSVGVLGALPGAYILFFMGFFLWMLINMVSHVKVPSPHVPQEQLFMAHLLVTLVLLVFDFLWLMLGSNFSQERKILWAVGVTFAAPIMIPTLYWRHLRKIPAGPYFLGKPLDLKRLVG